jgi:hypothetical protein
MELAKITETQNPYVLTLQSKRVTALKKQEAVTEYIDMLTKVYFEAGHAMPGKTKEEQVKQLQILSIAFHEEVQTYFKFMRVEEIRQALKNGVRKQYGDFHGINIASLHNWIKGYISDDNRKQALLKLKQENEKEPEPLVSKEQAEQLWREAILKQFRKFKETGHFICEFPTFQYQQFEKRGLINLTKERKKELYEQAKAEILEGFRIRRLNPKNKLELNSLSDSIQRITEGKHSETDEKNILNQARRLALKDLYQNIESLNL